MIIAPPPRTTRTHTLFPYTTLFRSRSKGNRPLRRRSRRTYQCDDASRRLPGIRCPFLELGLGTSSDLVAQRPDRHAKDSGRDDPLSTMDPQRLPNQVHFDIPDGAAHERTDGGEPVDRSRRRTALVTPAFCGCVLHDPTA